MATFISTPEYEINGVIMEYRSRKELLDEVVATTQGSEKSNMEWIFFYDETNNFQSLRGDREKVLRGVAGAQELASPLVSPFILGGIAVENEAAEALICQKFLGKNFPTQVDKWTKKGEVKYRGVFGKKIFENIIGNKAFTEFISLLETEGCWVHFTLVNVFDYAVSVRLAGILSRLLGIADKGIDYTARTGAIADTITNFTIDNRKDYVEILYDAGYPNIDTYAVLRQLNDALRDYLQTSESKLPPAAFVAFEQDPQGWYLTRRLFNNVAKYSMLRSSDKIGPVNFGQTEERIIDSMTEFYLIPPLAEFPRSAHRFDYNKVIKDDILYNYKDPISNVQFIHSANSIGIQVSDVWVGLVSKFDEYLNSVISEILLNFSDHRAFLLCQVEDTIDVICRERVANMPPAARINLRKLCFLILDSKNYDENLVQFIDSSFMENLRWRILSSFACWD